MNSLKLIGIIIFVLLVMGVIGFVLNPSAISSAKWYFATLSTNYGIASTIGPFPNLEACEQVRTWVSKRALKPSLCWSIND